MTREQVIEYLLNHPVDYARMLGFTKLSSLHNEWIIDMVRGQGDKTLQAHRGSYKTTCVSIALSLIVILLPSKRTMFMRKTDSDVKEIIKQVQNILADPHTQYFVQCIYDVTLKMQTQSVTEISTNLNADLKGTSQLIGIGVGSSLTGKHYDRIFTDDIVNINDRISRAEREKTKLIYQELQNIKNTDGRIYNTGTPWHKEDAFSIMPAPVKYPWKDTGIITPEQAEEIKSRMTDSLFAANYELKHIADDEIMFAEPVTGADPELVRDGMCHVDAAYGGEDYTAFTICKVKDGKFYVYGKMWHKHIDDVMGEIAMLYESFMCGKMYMETNADKGFSAKEFRAQGLRVSTYHESMNKYIKISSYLKFNWKDIVFVKGTDDEYINQICDYNENAEHDDAPDSLASIVRIMSRKKTDYEPLFIM